MKLLSIRSAALMGLGIFSALAAIAADDKATEKAADKSAVAKADQGKFVKMFDGKTLDGWHGDKDWWKVENGTIVGCTDDKELKGHNSFLIYEKPYKNFVLKAKFKLRNHNSGIQFRSKELNDFICSGYQADMAEKKYTGNLYEEKGRGTLVQVNEEEFKPHLKTDDWNELTITADGPHIKQEINGFTTVDYEEKDSVKGATDGIIALQLHAGPKMRVEFKDLEIKQLP